MTNQEPRDKPNEGDLFDQLNLFELDPKINGIMKAVKIAQEKQHDMWSREEAVLESRKSLGKLNSFLVELNLISDHVTLYGKLRIAPWVSDEDRDQLLSDPLFQDRTLIKGQDESGEYWQLADHTLQLCPIDTDESEENQEDPISYVFTFRTERQAQEIEEDYEDPEYRGDLIMYPGEVEYIRPSVPSCEYVENLLQTTYPELYARINELLPKNDILSEEYTDVLIDAQRIERLSILEIPSSLHMTADDRKAIGIYLLTRLELDGDAEHIFRTYKKLEGLSEEDEWIEQLGKKRKIRGKIYGVEIDPQTNEISYLIAELSSDYGDGGYELRRLTPGTSVEVQNSRPRPRKFGDVAMRDFSSLSDIARWSTGRSKPAIPEDVRFVEIVEKIETPSLDYVEKAGWHEIAVDHHDLTLLQADFDDHCEAHRDLRGVEELSRDITRDFPSLDEHLSNLESISVGGTYVFKDELCVTFPDGSRSSDASINIYFNKQDNTALKGTLLGLRGAWFISPGQEKEEFALAALLEDPCLVTAVDSNNEDLLPLVAKKALVRLKSPDVRIYQIAYKTA